MLDELNKELEEHLTELTELGEVFFEFHIEGKDTHHVELAIAEVTRKTRRLEEKIRKQRKK